MVCVQVTGAAGNLGASLGAVSTFADHCQAILSLTYWPAQTLCNTIPGIHFPVWIGEECNVKCIFGKADPSKRTNCKCDAGYWGEECDEVCPGGILNPCGNRGRCSKATGTCNCDVNWQGNDNCTTCSPGWYGDKCQYAVSSTVSNMNNSIATATVFGLGYFSTFQGIAFTLKSHGEFYLLRSKSDNFAVQIRQGICIRRNRFQDLCTVGFAISYNNIKISIRAPIRAVSRSATMTPLIWLNKELVPVNHVTQLSVFFVMIRKSSVTYSIKGPRGIAFEMQVGESLSLICRIPHVYCVSSRGLLGSCLQPYKETNSSQVENQIRTLKKQSRVDQADALFIYKYKDFIEPRVLTGGGFSLVFTDSFVVSSPLFVENVNILSLELMVRIRSYGGVIFSYAKIHTFAVINDQTLKISYKGQNFNTGIPLEVEQWNQISLVFNNFIGTLKVFVFNSIGTVKIRVYKLDTQVWAQGGVLAFGQWQSTNDNSKPPESTFYGDIDEVRIWDRRSNPDLVKSGWKLNVKSGIFKGLLHLWKLNQVEGAVVQDSAGNCDLVLKKFHKPLWSFSSLNITNVKLTNANLIDEPFKEKAKTTCYSVLLSGSLFSKCKGLGVQVAQFFYASCLYELSVTLDLQSAVSSVISFADYCQHELNLPKWPGKELCHLFPNERFPYWIGRRCSSMCVFGYPVVSSPNDTSNLVCKCEYGYWGETCKEICPGALHNVCNKRGVCDEQNGTCSCEPRWDGHTDNTEELPCTRCSEGWTGAHCNIAFNKNSSDNGLTINFGDPHFTTVTGVSYNLETPGAFLLLNTTNVTVQILQIPCNNRVSCRRISELALKTKTFTLSVKYIDLQMINTLLTDNQSNLKQPLKNSDLWEPFTVDESSHYRWPTANILEMVLPDGENVNVLFYNGTIGTAVELPYPQQGVSRGLGGSTTGQWIDILRAPTPNSNASILTQDLLDTNLTSAVRLSQDDSFLTSEFSNHHFEGAGFMLGFDHSCLSIDGDDTIPVLDEFTIEFWFCLVNEESSIDELCSKPKGEEKNRTDTLTQGKHALLSSTTATNTYAILYDNGLTVKWGDQIIQTNVSINEGRWIHVAITWRANDGRIQVLTSTATASYVSTAYGVQLGKQLDITGVFVLGNYFKGSEAMNEYDLHGAMDEIRLWQYAKTENEISMLRKVKFDYYIEGLVLSVPLDQGYGTNVSANMYRPLDSISTRPTNHSRHATILYLRANEENGIPTWLPSGVQTTPLTNYTLAFYNDSLQEESLNLCNKWFYTGNVQRLCSSRLASQARFYYEACLADIADGANLAHHKLSISLFGFYCQKVLGIEECKLHGTYDAFPPCFKEARDVGFPVVVVVITAVVVVVVIVLCCCIVCCCVSKKNRRKKLKCDSPLDVYVDDPLSNTYTMGSPFYLDEPDQGQQIALGPMKPLMQQENAIQVKTQGDTNFMLDLYGETEEENETNL